MNFWTKIIAVLAGIWIVAGAAIYWARSEKPTPASLTAYWQRADLAAKTGADRAKVVERFTGMFNQLEMEERRELRGLGVSEKFFRALTPLEQAAFLDATLPGGFKQMMESFNRMEPAKRKAMVERALSEMRKQDGQPPKALDDQNAQRIVDQGLRSFYSDASADVKLDLAPLIEQMQRNLQHR